MRAAAVEASVQTIRRVDGHAFGLTHIADEFPHDEYLVVKMALVPRPPRHRDAVTTCDWRVSRAMELTPGQSEYRSGPFDHHYVDDYTAGLDGVR